MYNSQEITERIKCMAKEKKISINKLLEECELGKNTIFKMSTGTDILTLNFAKIADKLNCSVDYLLGRKKTPTIDENDRVILLFNRLSERDKGKIEARIETMLESYNTSEIADDMTAEVNKIFQKTTNAK